MKLRAPTARTLPWPFSPIDDASGSPTGFVAVHGPLVRRRELKMFDSLRTSHRFVGFTSYADFPRSYVGGAELWLDACEGWCHCFREPGRYLPPEKPSVLISYSDFVDLRPRIPASNAHKRYDAVFVCAADAWQEYTKGWALAQRCIAALSNAGFDVVVVGRTDLSGVRAARTVALMPQLGHRELLDVVAGSRCLVVSGVMDASPRLVAESLCLDVPVAVNRAILGGWKYVNRYTGRFFDDERSCVEAVTAAIDACTEPFQWFMANYGPYVSGRRLARFLRQIDAGFTAQCVSPGGWRPVGENGA